MPARHEIRADYTRDTLVVYQAYAPAIALPALAAGRFVPPFSFRRMTWIKPSLLWLMHRSNWGRKAGQEHALAVRITRAGWDEALRLGVLTAPEAPAHRDYAEWKEQFDQAAVHVQWDPERTLRGVALPHDSIQVGLSRHVIRRFVEEWIVEMRDLTPLVKKIHHALQSGHADRARKLLPPERVYPIPAEVGRRLLIEATE